MGNVNGREDGNGSPSGSGLLVEEEEDEDEIITVAASSSSALMGHSPPQSPRTVQSPLKFAPQVRFPLLITVFGWIDLMSFWG